MTPDDIFLRLGLALAIGFMIGLERGWHERDAKEGTRTAGLRTFTLIGLLGGVCGALSMGGDRLLLAAGFLMIGGALAAYMWREGQREKDFSATSLIAAVLTYVLGAFAVLGDMAVASGAGVAAAIFLAAKPQLHGWLGRLTWLELRSGLLLAAMTFIALPLLPDRSVDPWGALNPHDLWLMTILIAVVSFAGYAAVKIAGPHRGLLVAATLGGLVASTAVTLSLARLARHNTGHLRLLAGGILASGTVMLLRVLAVTALINLRLAEILAVPLVAAAAAMGLVAIAYVLGDRGKPAHKGRRFVLRNPFDLGEVIKFGLLLAVVSVAMVLARRYWGDAGLLGLAALSGLTDVDALTLSVSRLGGADRVAAQAILLTVLVNTLAKNVYAALAGNRRLALLLFAGTIAGAAAGLLALQFD